MIKLLTEGNYLRGLDMKKYRFYTLPLLAVSFLGHAWGQSACDLDGNGSTNVVDVSRAVNMALGSLPCTANVEGPQVCSVITVQRVVNAALGNACVTYSPVTGSYVVTLSWLPSLSQGITGYNIYRRTTPTGTPSKVATVTGTTLADSSVTLGQSYYYSATAVDASGNESSPSNQTVAVIPAN